MKHLPRRLLLALTATAVFSLVFVGGVSATHSNGTGPPKDLAAGTGTLAVAGNPMIHVNAQKDSDGNVTGHFYVKYPPTSTSPLAGLQISGHVTCLNVVGTAMGGIAGVGGKVERSNTGQFAGQDVLLTIIDNGEPGTADQANWGPESGASQNCSDDLHANGAPLQSGNYIVHKDPPPELLTTLDTLLAQFEAAAGDCPYANGG